MNYNTTRADLVIPEYGRHIQNMVNLAIEIKVEAERNLAAKTIIKVMGQYNPSLRDVEEFNNKLWDHLHIMSNYQLDVDSPFPKPTPEERKSAPEKPSYGTEQKRFKHYGRLILEFIEHAKTIEDEEEKKALCVMIANMMKKAYLMWNKDSVQDDEIIGELKRVSGGDLILPDDTELVKNIDLGAKPSKRRNHKPKRKKR